MEVPGTAPGSAALIPISVYHHSRRTDPWNMRLKGGFRKVFDAKAHPLVLAGRVMSAKLPANEARFCFPKILERPVYAHFR